MGNQKDFESSPDYQTMKTEIKHTKEQQSSLQKAVRRSFFKVGGESKPFFPKTDIQAKLNINEAEDKYEQEADAMADQVVQRYPEEEEQEVAYQSPRESYAGEIESAELPEDEKEARIQRKEDARQSEPKPEFVQQLQRSQSGGRPLPKDTRKEMEGAFGTDFSRVRIHKGREASSMSKQIGAQAFTHKNHIYFKQGTYNPQSNRGKHLLAHELTHTVQQGVSKPSIQKDDPTTTPTEVDPVDKLKKELVSTYSLASVEDGSASWTEDELKIAKDALAKLPTADQAAIKGVKLMRVSALGGNIAGQFESSQSVNDTTVSNEASIKIANNAFGGDRDESVRLVVHEVGHAVASQVTREKTNMANEARATANKLVGISNAASDTLNPASNAFNSGPLADYNAAVKELNAARRSKDKTRITTAQQDFDAKKKVYEVERKKVMALEQDYKQKKKASKAAEKTAKSKEKLVKGTLISKKQLKAIKEKVKKKKKAFDKVNKSAWKGLKEDDTESSAFQQAVKATGTAIESFATNTVAQDKTESEIEAEESTVDTAMAQRNQERQALNIANKNNPALAKLAGLEAAQDAWYEAAKVHAYAKDRHKRVQKFVAFVSKKKIAPITPYAQENWPHKPEEFYAEAYSFWLVKPKDLKSTSKLLYDWFAQGKYEL